MLTAPEGSPSAGQSVPPASGAQFPQPQIPNLRSQAKDPKLMSQAKDPKAKDLKAEDSKAKDQS